MNKNSLLSMRDLSVEDIYSILDDARLFNSSFKDWQLPMQKALVANLFLRHQLVHISHSKVRSTN